MTSWIRLTVLAVVSVVAFACGDDDDVSSNAGNPPTGILDEGGLSPGLLTLGDLGNGWVEAGVEPPNGSASHFVCMPLYFEGAFDQGVSVEFSGPTEDLEGQGTDVSQRVVRYADAEAAMRAAPDALAFCLARSSLASFGEPNLSSPAGVGDENLLAELVGDLDATVSDSAGDRVISEEIEWRAAYIRRGNLVTLLFFVQVEEDEFERLIRLADERLQELD